MPRARTDQKFRGESFDHVEGFFKILEDVKKRNPGILFDGERVWNMDETSISSEFGKRIKVFGSSQTHHGGFVSSSTRIRSGTHVTAVIAVSASGRKTPPFFIVQGKKSYDQMVRSHSSRILMVVTFLPRITGSLPMVS